MTAGGYRRKKRKGATVSVWGEHKKNTRRRKKKGGRYLRGDASQRPRGRGAEACVPRKGRFHPPTSCVPLVKKSRQRDVKSVKKMKRYAKKKGKPLISRKNPEPFKKRGGEADSHRKKKKSHCAGKKRGGERRRGEGKRIVGGGLDDPMGGGERSTSIFLGRITLCNQKWSGGGQFSQPVNL